MVQRPFTIIVLAKLSHYTLKTGQSTRFLRATKNSNTTKIHMALSPVQKGMALSNAIFITANVQILTASYFILSWQCQTGDGNPTWARSHLLLSTSSDLMVIFVSTLEGISNVLQY